MASGQNHDKATRIWCIPIGLLVGVFVGITEGVLASIAFVIGGLWLSPDLDIHSTALKRWGLLKIVWWPYRKLIRHRSFLSHAPFIGTALRLLYLSSMVLFIKILINSLGIEFSLISIINLRNLIEKYPQQIIAIIVGIETSVWLHLIQDGDPLPNEWRKTKKKKRKL